MKTSLLTIANGITRSGFVQFHALVICFGCVGCSSREAFQRIGLSKSETMTSSGLASPQSLAAAEKPPTPEIFGEPSSKNAIALSSSRSEMFSEPLSVMPVSLETADPMAMVSKEVKRPSNPIVELRSSAEFPTLISKSDGPVLLDFHASWCGPCKKQSGELKEVSPLATKNNARIVKIDVDAHPEIASQFNVKSLPTLVVLRDGQVAHRKLGFTPADELASMIQR
ncbi:MAG: thioredoxin domain-containing protein [Planctomycetota bacterium]